jgi:hypothetical protein
MSTPALYQLATEYQQQFYQLAELDLPDEVVTDTLEAMEGDIQVKAANVAMFVRQLEHTADGIKAAEKQMAERRKAIERRGQRITEYLLTNMQACGITKIEHPMLRLSVRANPESVDVFDADQVPAEFMRQPEPPPAAPDKTRIKDALKSGMEVPGCRLARGSRLEIK